MSTQPKLPLSEAQERHITVTLALLEKHLTRLREYLQGPSSDSRLVLYKDPITIIESEALLPIIAKARTEIQRIADELGLKAQIEPVRGSFIAGFELATIHLSECRAGSGMEGYGELASATADYLERELPKLDAVIRLLAHRLRTGNE